MRFAGSTSPVGTNQRPVSPRNVLVAGRVSEVEGGAVDWSVEGVAACCAIAGNATPSRTPTADNLSSCLMTASSRSRTSAVTLRVYAGPGQTWRLRLVVGSCRSFATKDPSDADAEQIECQHRNGHQRLVHDVAARRDDRRPDENDEDRVFRVPPEESCGHYAHPRQRQDERR